MSEKENRDKLLEFLDQRAFEPVLQASKEKYPADQRKMLKDVQSTTKSTQKRYHNKYDSPQEIYNNFKNDLSSASAQAVHQQLQQLGLPTLKDIRSDFEKLANDLGVS